MERLSNSYYEWFKGRYCICFGEILGYHWVKIRASYIYNCYYHSFHYFSVWVDNEASNQVVENKVGNACSHWLWIRQCNTEQTNSKCEFICLSFAWEKEQFWKMASKNRFVYSKDGFDINDSNGPWIDQQRWRNQSHQVAKAASRRRNQTLTVWNPKTRTKVTNETKSWKKTVKTHENSNTYDETQSRSTWRLWQIGWKMKQLTYLR